MSLNDILKIATIPINSIEGDKKANLLSVEQRLTKVPKGIDVVVLPELFSTGYSGEKEIAKKLAEHNDGFTIQALKRLSKMHGFALCGSFLACTGPMLFNRAFFIEPNGEATFYDKRHLFVLGEESKIFKAGISLPPVVRYRGWNICMSVCYDLRFPVWLRNTGNKYDVLIFPANWPDRRGFAWEHLLRARAIENQCYIVGANRSGEDEFGVYDNLSFIFDFSGNSISEQFEDGLIATLDKVCLNTIREKLPVWKDADEFTVKLY